MPAVSFDQWMKTLRACAKRHGIELKGSAQDHRVYYDNGDTPYGAVLQIKEFGYDLT
jgi:hypothetical protein